jgi:hypothetical protein
VPNVAGQAYALSVFTPILPGHVAELRQHLEQLGSGAQSPLAALPATHFARWVIIDDLVYEGAPQEHDTLHSQYLLFESCLDGDSDTYIEAMRTAMAVEADAIWGHCAGYPGSGAAAAFAAYMRHNQIAASFFVAAYPDATVEDVRESLALRERIIELAIATQDVDAVAALAAYRRMVAKA